MWSLRRSFQSALAVMQDLLFDHFYGLNTSEIVEVSLLDIHDSEKEHAVRYKPTRVRYMQQLFRQCALPLNGVFVDVGCGKGRVLMLAAKHGFRRCVGIELSPSLAREAIRNREQFKTRYPDLGEIEIHCLNILNYSLHRDENIYHLFWPFDRIVTQQFLAKLRDSLHLNPRDCWLIINEFQFHDLLKDDDLFQHKQRIVYGASEFEVYFADKGKK